MKPFARSIVLLLLVVAQPERAPAETSGRLLAMGCASCHRPDGHDTAMPPIIGLSEGRIVELMSGFRSDAGAPQIMHVVAGALTTEEIAAVARYLAEQRPVAVR